VVRNTKLKPRFEQGAVKTMSWRLIHLQHLT